MEGAMTRHHFFDPEGVARPVGFSYGALPAEGTTLHIAGITGQHEDGSIAKSLVDQFRDACESVARVIDEAGGDPEDMVSMIIFTSEIDGYRSNLEPIGEAYRSVFGRHYPPMALLGVSALLDPRAAVELVCVAVVGDRSHSSRTTTGSS